MNAPAHPDCICDYCLTVRAARVVPTINPAHLERAWDIETDTASPHRRHVVHALDEGRWHCVTCEGPLDEGGEG